MNNIKINYKQPFCLRFLHTPYGKKCFYALLLLVLATQAGIGQVQRSRNVKLMGSPFDITIVSTDSLSAERYIDTAIAEISRIEYLISDWKPESQVSAVNAHAGIAPVKVDREVLELTQRAIRISELTHGAFDISFAAMEKMWRFDGSMTEMPDSEAVKKSVQKVGYKNIEIDTLASTIFLRLPGMKIGFGALGEGYAADRCRKMMMDRGVPAGIVNGSGDMNTWGTKPDGRPWKVGISDPFRRGELYAVVPLRQSAIVTSGSYEKYATINGRRYAHIINPATGYPATGLISVTVTGPSAEMANAFSTSIMVMGRKSGLQLLKQFPEYRCIIIADDGNVTATIKHMKRVKD